MYVADGHAQRLMEDGFIDESRENREEDGHTSVAYKQDGHAPCSELRRCRPRWRRSRLCLPFRRSRHLATRYEALLTCGHGATP